MIVTGSSQTRAALYNRWSRWTPFSLLRAPHEDTSRWPRTFDCADTRLWSPFLPLFFSSSSPSSKSSNGGNWWKRRRQIARRGQFVKRGEKLRAHYSLDLTRRHLEILRTPRARGKLLFLFSLFPCAFSFPFLAAECSAAAVSPTICSSPSCRTSELCFRRTRCRSVSGLLGSADRCHFSRRYKRPPAGGEERTEQKQQI